MTTVVTVQFTSPSIRRKHQHCSKHGYKALSLSVGSMSLLRQFLALWFLDSSIHLAKPCSFPLNWMEYLYHVSGRASNKTVHTGTPHSPVIWQALSSKGPLPARMHKGEIRWDNTSKTTVSEWESASREGRKEGEAHSSFQNLGRNRHMEGTFVTGATIALHKLTQQMQLNGFQLINWLHDRTEGDSKERCWPLRIINIIRIANSSKENNEEHFHAAFESHGWWGRWAVSKQSPNFLLGFSVSFYYPSLISGNTLETCGLATTAHLAALASSVALPLA